MSPYAEELARARLDALRTLIDALNEAESPDEKRRCAVAIFNAPDPCDLDEEIQLEDDEDDHTDSSTALAPVTRSLAAPGDRPRLAETPSSRSAPASESPPSAAKAGAPPALTQPRHLKILDLLAPLDLGPPSGIAPVTPVQQLLARAGRATGPPPDDHRLPNSDLIAVHRNLGSDFTLYGTYSDTMMHVHPPIVRGVPCSAPAPTRK